MVEEVVHIMVWGKQKEKDKTSDLGQDILNNTVTNFL